MAFDVEFLGRLATVRLCRRYAIIAISSSGRRPWRSRRKRTGSRARSRTPMQASLPISFAARRRRCRSTSRRGTAVARGGSTSNISRWLGDRSWKPAPSWSSRSDCVSRMRMGYARHCCCAMKSAECSPGSAKDWEDDLPTLHLQPIPSSLTPPPIPSSLFPLPSLVGVRCLSAGPVHERRVHDREGVRSRPATGAPSRAAACAPRRPIHVAGCGDG